MMCGGYVLMKLFEVLSCFVCTCCYKFKCYSETACAHHTLLHIYKLTELHVSQIHKCVAGMFFFMLQDVYL